MHTKLHAREQQVLGYLMQNLWNAPGYSVWAETHWSSQESNLQYLKEVQETLEITPEELWLQMLACYTLINMLKREQEIDTTKVTRVELIDETGRIYTNYECNNVNVSIQDENKTLKVFLKNNTNANETMKE